MRKFRFTVCLCVCVYLLMVTEEIIGSLLVSKDLKVLKYAHRDTTADNHYIYNCDNRTRPNYPNSSKIIPRRYSTDINYLLIIHFLRRIGPRRNFHFASCTSCFNWAAARATSAPLDEHGFWSHCHRSPPLNSNVCPFPGAGVERSRRVERRCFRRNRVNEASKNGLNRRRSPAWTNRCVSAE